jgi:hypothetical protein
VVRLITLFYFVLDMMSPSNGRGKNKTETVSSVQGGRDWNACQGRDPGEETNVGRGFSFFFFFFIWGRGDPALPWHHIDQLAASSPLLCLNSVLL